MRIAMVAAELSGDSLGAALASDLRQRVPQVEIYGVAGPAMRAAGCEALFRTEDLSVMGLVEVLRHYRRLSRIRDELRLRLLRQPPDVFVGIDAPDFNLGLARSLREAGIPTVQYVGPTVWAWRPGRVVTVARSVDRVLVVFPFEKDIYARNDVDAVFVGHSLARAIPIQPDRDGAREALDLSPDATVLAVLPGSRINEVRTHTAALLGGAKQCLERQPELQVIVASPTEAIASEVRSVAESAGFDAIDVRVNMTREVLIASNAVATVSGTASLESMLCKRPMVVAYKTSWLTYQLARRLVKVAHIALPNILADERLVPELVQDQVTPERVAEAASAALSGSMTADLNARFVAMHESLMGDEPAADAVLEVCAQCNA